MDNHDIVQSRNQSSKNLVVFHTLVGLIRVGSCSRGRNHGSSRSRGVDFIVSNDSCLARMA